MHDIWNPWHGCVKVSEGCENCYMFFLDRIRREEGGRIFKTRNFNYPLQQKRNGEYKIQSGELIRVCMTSDFFLPEADSWRAEAWSIMRERSDVKFFLLTKRPERVLQCLPSNWENGWDNIFFNVTCENQYRTDQRLPILLNLPFKHKGVMATPLLSRINMEKYLASRQIEQVIAGGENYDGSRPCHFEWITSLSDQCKRNNVNFCFIETGTNFIKNGRLYNIPNKRLQSEMAFKANVNHMGKPIVFCLRDPIGFEIEEDHLYKPFFRQLCMTCGSRQICNGCSGCGKCKE